MFYMLCLLEALRWNCTLCKYGAFRDKKGQIKNKELYLKFDWLLEDRGATGGLVLCPETVLRHNTVTEGWDLERHKKRLILRDNDPICVFTVTNGILQKY